MRKIILYIIPALAVLASICVYIAYRVIAELPASDIQTALQGLNAPAYAETDNYGIPAIHAKNREDAFLLLGFVTARDRLFQMDLLRRHMAGQLAEVMGGELVDSDRWHRVMGFEQVAHAIVGQLPQEQKRVLEAYAQGVNQAMASLRVLPPEFLLLGYHPSPWRLEDSLLIVLGMEEDLGWTGNGERRASIMEAALPKSVMTFFLPPLDHYTDWVLNGKTSTLPKPSIPSKELAALLDNIGPSDQHADLAGSPPPAKGSNGWVVGSAKTWDGRAILANDMHLSLRIPNIWYRAGINYGDVKLTGLTLPGVPLLVVGSNSKVAWGFTNIEGDFVDLVALEFNPTDPGSYRTPKGWAKVNEREETVKVKDGKPITFNVQITEWGPILPESLSTKPTAVHWVALDPKATDLSLLDLDTAKDVMVAQKIFNQAGGPPLNALIADSQGNIGWTYTGKIPKRFGLDGSVSRSWADGSIGWVGYVLPDELPRLLNPRSGFIVNANQRMLGANYPYVIGHYFDHGYRAYRISERLLAAVNITERDMFALQLDTKTEFYRFYQRLALSLLQKGQDKAHIRLAQELENWDGFAERESKGLAILVQFRELLLNAVISPFMAKCRDYDPKFRFISSMIDTPLQQLLTAKLPELLPDKAHYRDWDGFLLSVLLQAEAKVLAHHPADAQGSVMWGAVNQVAIHHPFSSSLPLLQKWLDMPQVAMPGCVPCVRVSAQDHGASERLVVSPGHEGTGILHIPGGQSGHPLSPHYNDQQQAWAEGLVLPLETGVGLHRLEFVPVQVKQD
ncbi:penicillin acylase family protein [Methylovulum psychrotolerans]|uniref:penicillin acylase family protein n=1 Tax=Methylovulum psychrotolerans TaxID=1704499 RepID=UPI001BFF7F4D|nr:penicillin acylase family protein [Methylovulum psychrotolerans]MBT9099801.1 penicillin acylase family protein [Methylovulum psychrotolerans]